MEKFVSVINTVKKYNEINHLKNQVEEYKDFAKNGYENEVKKIKDEYEKEVKEKNEYKEKLDSIMQENEELKNENKALTERMNSIPKWIVRFFCKKNKKALNKGE